ncbi:hypothetical protein H6F95_28665 [Cyanobacteria bacterium FACHB-471]|nr:hypothetical protein [Cyanobacteria bacterium FACHB-471]
MHSSLPVTVRYFNQTQKARVQLPVSLKIEQLIQEIQKRWNLPLDVNYAVRLDRTGQQLDPSIIVMELSLEENDILDIYPIPEAG